MASVLSCLVVVAAGLMGVVIHFVDKVRQLAGFHSVFILYSLLKFTFTYRTTLSRSVRRSRLVTLSFSCVSSMFLLLFAHPNCRDLACLDPPPATL